MSEKYFEKQTKTKILIIGEKIEMIKLWIILFEIYINNYINYI